MNAADRPFLPYGRQTIEADDIAAVAAALQAEMLTTGPTVAAFEAAFAAATGAAHAVVCNSGTAALHLAMLGLGLGAGDAVIVPSLTFLATANAARLAGAEVVFADVDPDTGLMGTAQLEAALGRARALGLRPRGAAPVHLAGQTCDMAALAQVAAARGLALVEDACHALGLDRAGACTHAAAACFSTHPVKAIAMGEGGVVTTRDAAVAARLRRLRSHGMVREAQDFADPAMALDAQGAANPWYYEMPEIGLNYRAPDILCALGLSQLAKLQRFVARRRALAALYDRRIAPLAPLLRPVPRVPWSQHAYHLYAVLIDFAAAGIDRAALMRRLRARGIGTQVHYIPVHRQPYYRARYGLTELPGADAYYRRCLSLPLFPAMADGDVERVVEALADVLQRRAA